MPLSFQIVRNRAGNAAAAHARPRLPHEAPYQPVAGGGLEVRLARQREQRCARLLRLEDPVEEARPPGELLERRKAGAPQGPGNLMASAQPYEGGDVAGGREKTVLARQHVEHSACVTR